MSRLLRFVLVALLATNLVSLAACGKKGPLYMAGEEPGPSSSRKAGVKSEVEPASSDRKRETGKSDQ